MLREIKFRAWDKWNKKMFDVDCIEFVGNECSKCLPNHSPLDDENDWQCWTEDCQCNLMQFTGLKDKNGKEIYEGDILKADEKWFELGNDVGIVGLHKGQYCVHDNEWDNTDYITNREVEIIGNIYENPELLNQKSCLEK